MHQRGWVFVPIVPGGIGLDLIEATETALDLVGLTGTNLIYLSPVADAVLGHANFAASGSLFVVIRFCHFSCCCYRLSFPFRILFVLFFCFVISLIAIFLISRFVLCNSPIFPQTLTKPKTNQKPG